MHVTLRPASYFRKAVQSQKKALKDLKAMFDTTAYFDSDHITSILMVSL